MNNAVNDLPVTNDASMAHTEDSFIFFLVHFSDQTWKAENQYLRRPLRRLGNLLGHFLLVSRHDAVRPLAFD